MSKTGQCEECEWWFDSMDLHSIEIDISKDETVSTIVCGEMFIIIQSSMR